MKRHFEKYGYKPVPQNPVEVNGCEAAATEKSEDAVREKQRGEDMDAEQAGEEEDPGKQPCTTPTKNPLLETDPLRTPRLSDFGLSEYHFPSAWGVSEKPAATQSSQSQCPPITVSLPSLPKTPKCELKMDDEAFTPRLEGFGISDYTMCLNNDFTMDLLRNKPSQPASFAVQSGYQAAMRTAQDPSTPAQNKHMEENAVMNSPVPPVFCTPGFKINKKQAPPSPPNLKKTEPTHNNSSTPELPSFETPFFKKLIHDRGREAAGPKEKAFSHLHPQSPGVPVYNNHASCDVPTFSDIQQYKNDAIPELPNFQSLFCSKLTHFQAPGYELSMSPGRGIAELDLQMPERPDFSSVTEDIFKHLSQCNAKPSLHVSPKPRPTILKTEQDGKENRVQSLATVSEKDFLTLPDYLRQIPLASLNQAIQRINRALDLNYTGAYVDSPASLMEESELKSVIDVGPKSNIYFLCLVELKRLKKMRTTVNSTVYKVVLSA
ncbi:SKA3 protein, partial [Amia calva]|nr:SKA3 protein [Amia calva]